MEIRRDGSDQPYVDVDKVRVTIRHPDEKDDWAGTGRYVGFRAYRNEDSAHLLMGADLPIRSAASDDAILSAVVGLLSLINKA